MTVTAWADIDLSALVHNAGVARALAPDSRVMAMIKADGYGHGLVPVAEALLGTADALAVARLEEAVALREAGIGAPVLVLGTLLADDELALCAHHGLWLVIHTEAQARQLIEARLREPLQVWLKLNTGMNRLGLPADRFGALHRALAGSPNVRGIVHMTHFSSAENLDSPATQAQIECLNRHSAGLGRIERSFANSAGIIAHPDSHGQWIRPGIMLYGDNPLAAHRPLALKPVMQLRSRVIAVHDIAAGQSVGYNARWTASRPSRIAAIGIGYGDGYPRHAPNGTPLLVNGERAPLVGRVSMDVISADVTALSKPVAIGDEVLLWGEGLPAAEVAELAGTISYELFTGVSRRVPRRYLQTSVRIL